MRVESIKSGIVCAAVIVAFFAAAILVRAGVQKQERSEQPIPRFEDYAVSEAFRGSPVALKFSRFAANSIRAKLQDHMSGQPNLAGHYEFVTWGCGTNCTAGAVVDLKTGVVYSPPLTERTEWLPEARGWGICAQSWEGPWEVRADSRLTVISCGWNYDTQGKNWPDVYYLLWKDNQFKELLHIRSPKK